MSATNNINIISNKIDMNRCAASDLVGPNYPKEFAMVSFAFAVVTGFCIGGAALSNVVGIAYTNKRISLRNAVCNIHLLTKCNSC